MIEKTHFVVRATIDSDYKFVGIRVGYEDDIENVPGMELASDTGVFPLYDNGEYTEEESDFIYAIELPYRVRTNVDEHKYIFIDTGIQKVTILTEKQVQKASINLFRPPYAGLRVENPTNIEIVAFDEDKIIIGAPLQLKDISGFKLSNLI